MASDRKTALIVLYNHNYEKNLPTIRKIYGERFSQILQLMPFYYGNDADVVPVYGNSFVFHTYIAQAKERMKQLDCDDFLIVGDDVLLHPDFNETSTHELLNLAPGAFYLDDIVNISDGEYYRAVKEASNFTTTPPGLDSSANRKAPTYEEAETILKKKGYLTDTLMKKAKPYWLPFEKPLMGNLYKNYRVLRARAWHLRNTLKNRLFPKRMSYPCVFGYSDIISVPRERLDEWCNLLEIFATWQMFVELAIPTATLLLTDAQISKSADTAKKTGNVWYPQSPAHFSATSALINELSEKCDKKISKLAEYFPQEYLYLHPVKLSAFRD